MERTHHIEIPVNEKYQEIIKLHEMLNEKKIRHILERKFDGWQIFYPDVMHTECSVIEFTGSYGASADKLEIMGLLTEQEGELDSVVGFLPAKEVFERIKEHWYGLPDHYRPAKPKNKIRSKISEFFKALSSGTEENR